jgi:gluconate kinase
MTLLLCFSGQIGSGKSSVSVAVAEVLDWKRTGFGDYLRAEIVRRGGDPTSREALQDLGQSRVHADPVAFCRDVLDFGGFAPDECFIVDGVRHVGIYDILADLASPATARLIFLQVGNITRAMRVQARRNHEDLARADLHRVEAESRDALPRRADAVIDAERSFDEVVAACIDTARGWS